MNELKETYNKIAKDWDRDHQSDDWWIEGTDAFISFLPKNGSVLDVGCGAGGKSKYLTDHGLTVLGIDFAKELVTIAKQKVPKAKFKVMDLYDAAKLTGTFDGILMQAVLLHIPKRLAGQVVKNISQLLKKDGYFCISVKEKWPGGKDEEIKTENDYGYEYKRFFSYFTAREVKEYLEKAGLEIVHENVHKSGKTNWLQVIGHKV